MTELSLKDAFEYQMQHTKPPSKPQRSMKDIEDKGGVEYIRKLKRKGYLKRDAVNEIGCSTPTFERYLCRRNTRWRDL